MFIHNCWLPAYSTLYYALDEIEHFANGIDNILCAILTLLLCRRALLIKTIDMESTSFDYSAKNIPIPSPKDYQRVLIDKTELLCRRMRWRAFFYLNPNLSGKRNETYTVLIQNKHHLKFHKCLTLKID